MADTDRLERLTEVVEHTGAKLVAIGDAAQLPSIGAGGMFERLSSIAPSAPSCRTSAAPSTPTNSARGRTCAPAAQTERWPTTTTAASCTWQTPAMRQSSRPRRSGRASPRPIDPSEVALISDASNQEIARLNARAQHFRSERGELGDLEVPVPGVHYGVRQGDRIALIEQHREPGVERIENGSRGEILDITAAGEVLVEFDVTGRQRTTRRRGSRASCGSATPSTSTAPRAPPSPARSS